MSDLTTGIREPAQPHGDKLIEDERLYDMAFAFHRGWSGRVDYGEDMVFHFHASDGSITGTHTYRLPRGLYKTERNAE